MKVTINGIEKTIDDGKTIRQILEELEIIAKVMAVAVNSQIVKKDAWDGYVPLDGDKIECLQFVGGG